MSPRAKLWLTLFAAAVSALVVAGGMVVWKVADAARRHRHAEREAAIRAQEDALRDADRAAGRALLSRAVAPTPGDLAAFEPLFDSLGRALDQQNAAVAASHFDLDRMFEQIVGRTPTASDSADFHRVGRQTFGSALVGNPQLRWSRTSIRRIRWSADHSVAVVATVHRDDAASSRHDLKMRWWLASTSNGWKIYDLEEIDGGLRFSLSVAQLLAPDGTVDPLRFQKAVDVLHAAQFAVRAGDADAAEKALAHIDYPNPPPPFSALLAMIEGRVQVLRGDFAAALRDYDRAAHFNPDMPAIHLARTIALARWGKFADALEEAMESTEVLGSDPAVSYWEGYCLEGLGRTADAVKAYAAALDESPDSADALHGLRRMLPPERKGELAARLGKTRKPLLAFDSLLSAARKDRDDAAAEALLDWLLKNHPDDVRAVLADIRDKARTKQFNAATVRLRDALKTATGDDRKQILTAYLLAMLQAGVPVEAYAGVPLADALRAFRTLAAELEERMASDRPTDPGRAAGQLVQLIAAHRTQHPDDPWLWYYEGVLLEANGKLDEAQTAFAAGQAKLDVMPATDANERKWDREAFRSRRTSCLYELKQGLKAYAEVGPPHDTFRQLAYRYTGDRDVAGLAELVGAHANAFPDDPLLLYWRAEVLYLKMEYLDAAAGFAAYLKVAAKADAARHAAIDKQVRALLRAGRSDAAKLVLMEHPEARLAPGLWGAVLAATEDAMGLGSLMAAQARQHGGLSSLYGDPDFARHIADEKFAPLRAKYPDPRPKPEPPQCCGLLCGIG